MITCNDVHRFIPEIALMLTIPFLHIASVTANAIKAKDLKSVAILRVRKAMEGDFYEKILAENGIQAVVPNETERAFIHDSIYDELVKTIFETAHVPAIRP